MPDPAGGRPCRDTEDCHLISPAAVLDRSAGQLAAHFANPVEPATVRRLVHESFALLEPSARIRTLPPILALRSASSRLAAPRQHGRSPRVHHPRSALRLRP